MSTVLPALPVYTSALVRGKVFILSLHTGWDHHLSYKLQNITALYAATGTAQYTWTAHYTHTLCITHQHCALHMYTPDKGVTTVHHHPVVARLLAVWPPDSVTKRKNKNKQAGVCCVSVRRVTFVVGL